MSEQKTIVHKAIMVAALMLSAAALPFSIKVCHAALIIVIVSWLLEGEWRTKLSVIQHSLLLQLLIALFFLQGLGLTFSDNLSSGWFTLEKKIFFLLIPVALATTALKLKRQEVKLVVITFICSCFVGTLLCVANAWNETTMVMAGQAQINPYLASSSYFDLHGSQSEKWLLFSYTSLSEGIAIHPTYFSLFLAFSIIFLLHEFPSLRSRIRQAGILMLMLYFTLFVVFLASRIVILGLSVIFIFVMIRTVLKKQTFFAGAVMGITCVFGSLLLLNPVSRYRSLQEINLSTFKIEPGNNYKNAAQIRASLWWLAFRSLNDSHPLYGMGTGDVEYAMLRASDQYRITNIINSFDPHNQYLYTLLGNGYAAFLLLILCLSLPVYFAWLEKDYLLLGFSFLFALLCFTESALELQKGVIFYSLFSALLFFQLNSFQHVSLNFRTLLSVRH
jgi:O-antigen ligase